MAITPDHLRSVLDASEIRYQTYDETTLLTVFSWEEERVDLVCSLWEQGEYLDVRTVNLGLVSRTDALMDRILPRVSRLNYDYKLARVSWGEDGELVVGASLPLEDRPEITPDQVAALITAVCQVAVELKLAVEEVHDEQAGEVTAPMGIPVLSTLDLSGVGRLLVGVGALLLGLAALVAAAALWVR